jgi:hypothetical protein
VTSGPGATVGIVKAVDVAEAEADVAVDTDDDEAD